MTRPPNGIAPLDSVGALVRKTADGTVATPRHLPRTRPTLGRVTGGKALARLVVATAAERRQIRNGGTGRLESRRHPRRAVVSRPRGAATRPLQSGVAAIEDTGPVGAPLPPVSPTVPLSVAFLVRRLTAAARKATAAARARAYPKAHAGLVAAACGSCTSAGQVAGPSARGGIGRWPPRPTAQRSYGRLAAGALLVAG